MTDRSPARPPADEGSTRWDAFGITLLRSWKRLIVGLGLLGMVVGVGVSLLTPRKYVSSATFIPQSSETALPGNLALAASQFGIRLPNTGAAWGPPIYLELLQSQVLLEPIANDSIAVAEEGGERRAVTDLLNVPESPPAERTEWTIRKLRKVITVSDDKRFNGVRVSVRTRWASVSLALADRLVQGVNQFNLESRKSQAAAERKFAEAQASEAEQALREAENRLQTFLQQNRSTAGSPQLTFAQDRLQREVTFRQQVYTSLTQSKEEARLREVRDTPVITILESPRLAAIGEPRRTVMKGILGGMGLALIGVFIAFVREGLADARQRQAGPFREVVRLLDETAPGFLRRAAR